MSMKDDMMALTKKMNTIKQKKQKDGERTKC